ncbi:hypothetical protein CkaCkLH20_11084 [Colletotrichum karsti]|uniref:Trichothecene 3-O-acetyltransferase n=1 Tax=Colletotrichum karsti TaxID=1095194 RepID=A0A9P6HUQ2_9PEZI|nr:uncharacterized protein CkaCkLH20_11084 [Colletotrichum karsti]KAF9871437.1 hypothetical protein CkaCkLH20_11084 [Colletotrichum karsti]
MEAISSRPSTPCGFMPADMDILRAEDRLVHSGRLTRSSSRSYLRVPRSAAVNRLFLNRIQSLGISKSRGQMASVVTVTSSRRDLLQGRCAPALIIHQKDGRLHLTFTSSEKAAQKLRQHDFPPDFTSFTLQNYRPPKTFRDSPRSRDSPRVPAPLIFYSGHKSPVNTEGESDTMGLLSENLLPLSPLDQIAPRIYVRTIFAFNLDDDHDSLDTRNHIAECFRRALIRWPFLAGQIRPAADDEKRLELSYNLDHRALDPARRPDLFNCQYLEELGGYTFGELIVLSMPPSAMDKDKLSHSPNHPKPGESCPPVTLRITEMEGGLFLCFSTHHGIMDGCFIKTFLDYFANSTDNDLVLSQVDGSYLSEGPAWVKELEQRPCLDSYQNLDIKGVTFPEYDFTRDTKSIIPKNKAPGAVCKMFSFDNSTIQVMKTLADDYVKEQYGSKAFVTTADTISAMVWVHVTRARLPHLCSSDKTNFTLTVDARPSLSPAFQPTAWGNIYTQTAASTNVASLVQLDALGLMPEDSLTAIFEAAWMVRQAIYKARDPDYVPSRIALAASLEDPAMEGAAFRKANQPDHAGLGCSVWYHMGADVDFKIPGTGGKADYVRKTWSANDGSMNIMQRRGMTKGEAPWDVLLALREDDMERICGDNELGRWTKSWIS